MAQASGALHCVALVLLLCLISSLTFGQSPSTLSFQGRLTDSGGTPINNASQSIKFALYKGSTKIWEETQSVNVVNGIYNVQLGAVVPVDTIKFNAPIDLGVKVGADAEMAPRTPLVAAALARGLPSLTTYYDEDVTRGGYNLLGGNPVNRISQGTVGAIVLGGGLDDLEGFENEVTGSFGVVVGGAANRASYSAAVVGGLGNRADGQETFVGGGNSNKATLVRDVVGGGLQNEATGGYSTVPGGSNNHAHGSYSFAAGFNAHARHVGTFVWSDWSKTLLSDSLYSTAANQFIVRAAGGVGINRAPSGLGIHLKQGGTSSQYGIRTEYSGDSDFWETWVDGLNDYNFSYNGSIKAWIDDAYGVYYHISIPPAPSGSGLQSMQDVLPSIMNLQPRSYEPAVSKSGGDAFVAFELENVDEAFPELTAEKDGHQGVNMTGLTMVSIKAIQELYAELQELRSELAQQRQEIADLRRRN